MASSSGEFKYQKYMIKSSCYGELQKVIQNLQKIEPFSLQSTEFEQTLRQFNEQHLSLVELKNNKSQYPILKIARLENGHYVDQFHKKQYKINHLKRLIEDEQQHQLDLPQPVSQLLQILHNKLTKYVDKYFREPYGAQIFMEITQDGALNVHLVFTSKNVQLSNFYTGEWNSVWKINKSSIEGTIAVRAHIFESGNVQMNQSKQITNEFQFTADMEQNATKIMKIIQRFQSQTQRELSDVYEEMPTGFFKHLRRIVPVTKTKMIWNVNALKMNKNLTQSKN